MLIPTAFDLRMNCQRCERPKKKRAAVSRQRARSVQ